MTLPMRSEIEWKARKGRPFQYRVRTLALLILVVAVWLGLILDPNTGPLILGLMAAFGIGVGTLLAAMSLGALGFGFCTVVTRTAGWLGRGLRWPDDPAGWRIRNGR